MDTTKLQQLFQQFRDEQKQVKDRNHRIMVVDGLNLFIRAFTGSPVMNHRGDHVGGLVGFMKTLFSLVQQFRPTRCVVVFDGIDGGKRRREKFPGYKSGRKNRDRLNRFVEVDGAIDEQESLKRQYHRLEQYLHVLPLTLICIDHIEADDAIAYITNQYFGNKEHGDIVIVSGDGDFLQLVSETVQVYSPTKRKLYDVNLVVKEFNITPRNFLTYRALTGDTSDSIPGVRGLGLKTMLKCFPEIKDRDIDVEGIIELSKVRIDEGNKMKVYTNVAESSDQILLNWELMQLDNVDIPGSKKQTITMMLDEGIYHLDKLKLKQMIYEDGLNNYFPYFDSWIQSTISQLDIYAELK